MSLKAKIEAVIYASEEPVTLLAVVGLAGTGSPRRNWMRWPLARQTLHIVASQDTAEETPDGLAELPAAAEPGGSPQRLRQRLNSSPKEQQAPNPPKLQETLG